MSSFEPMPTAPRSAREFRPADPLAGGFRADDPAAGVRDEPTAEEIAERAFAEGREAGLAELPWREAEAVRAAAEALEKAADDLSTLRRTYLREHRRAVVELALAIAEKLVRRAVEADRDVLVGVVERALASLGDDEPLVLQLSAADHEECGRGLAPELARLAESAGLKVEPDESLATGDCRIVAAHGDVDGRITELTRRLREELAAVVELDANGEAS